MNEKFPDATREEIHANDPTCIICREEMDTAKKLPCGHLFHFHCLRTWLERSQNCPTCRSEIPLTNEPINNAATAQRVVDPAGNNRAPAGSLPANNLPPLPPHLQQLLQQAQQRAQQQQQQQQQASSSSSATTTASAVASQQPPPPPSMPPSIPLPPPSSSSSTTKPSPVQLESFLQQIRSRASVVAAGGIDISDNISWTSVNHPSGTQSLIPSLTVSLPPQNQPPPINALQQLATMLAMQHIHPQHTTAAAAAAASAVAAGSAPSYSVVNPSNQFVMPPLPISPSLLSPPPALPLGIIRPPSGIDSCVWIDHQLSIARLQHLLATQQAETMQKIIEHMEKLQKLIQNPPQSSSVPAPSSSSSSLSDLSSSTIISDNSNSISSSHSHSE